MDDTIWHKCVKMQWILIPKAVVVGIPFRKVFEIRGSFPEKVSQNSFRAEEKTYVSAFVCWVKVQTERMYPSGKCVRRWQQKGDMTGVWGARQSKKLKLSFWNSKKTSKWYPPFKGSWEDDFPLPNIGGGDVSSLGGKSVTHLIGSIGRRTRWSWHQFFWTARPPMRIGLCGCLLPLFCWVCSGWCGSASVIKQSTQHKRK